MARKATRIGVFVCHCGLNIAASVDVKRVVQEIASYPGVVHAEDYTYMCSDPGQERIRQAIEEESLEAIVVAACSPSLHERTFRVLAASQGLSPYRCEVANIREQCSWPHADDEEMATSKALTIVRQTVERLRLNLPLEPLPVPLKKRALVIGAGVAGMQASLDIAWGGYETVLVERAPYIGGHTLQLSGTFPTLGRPPCLVAPMVQEVAEHPRIKVYTQSEVEEVSGYVGNFTVRIHSEPAFVDAERCTGCGACLECCPVSVPCEFDRGLSQRKAIYVPPPAVSQVPVIDAASCLRFQGGDCRACQEACPHGAIDFSRKDTVVEEEVGAIVVATGYDLFPRENVPEYAPDPDVIDGLQFERILSPSGPTGGQVTRPSDGQVPREVVFLSCVGSREPERGLPYCSRVCCMYLAKQAVLYKRAVPQGQAYVFYMDVQSDAKGFEEFVQQAVEEHGVVYLRGKASRVFREGERLKVWGTDTLSGKNVEVAADLVVLALGMVPSPGARELARKLNIISDQHGFLTEAHIKLRPVETLTAGIYLAGAAQWPRDLPDTVSSASGAASKVVSLFSRQELLHEPTVAWVETEVCTGCGQCVSVCPYQAIQVDPGRRVAVVNPALCEGCGACVVACPAKAVKHRNWTPEQFFQMIDAATAEYV